MTNETKTGWAYDNITDRWSVYLVGREVASGEGEAALAAAVRMLLLWGDK